MDGQHLCQTSVVLDVDTSLALFTLQHVDEIAAMAIDLLAAVKQVKIPHKPDEKLMLRIGLHTGRCIVFNDLPLIFFVQ